MALLVKEYISQFLEKHDDWHCRLSREWHAVVGSLEQRIRLEKIYGDTMVIGVYDSHWMQELYLLSSDLCDRINSFMGEQRIQHVRFTLVERRKARTVTESQKKRLSRPKEIQLSSKQSEALASVTDKDLQQALTDFWGRCSLFFEG